MKSSENSQTVLTTTQLDYSKLLQKNVNMKNKRHMELKGRVTNLKKMIREYELEMLEIKLEVVKESELDISTKSTNRLVDICKKLDGTTYISGNGSRNYIDNTLFKKQNIELIFQNYLPKEYKQISSKKFIPNLSIIDLLVNFGSDSKKFVNEEFLNYN